MSEIHEEQSEILKELNAYSQVEIVVKDFLMGYLSFDEAKKIGQQMDIAKQNCLAKLGKLFYQELGTAKDSE
jgi:hypothetical protein